MKKPKTARINGRVHAMTWFRCPPHELDMNDNHPYAMCGWPSVSYQRFKQLQTNDPVDCPQCLMILKKRGIEL